MHRSSARLRAWLGFFLLSAGVLSSIAHGAVPVLDKGFYLVTPPEPGQTQFAGASEDASFAAGLFTAASGNQQLLVWEAESGARIVEAPSGWRIQGVSAVSRDGSTVVGRLQTGVGQPTQAFRWTEAVGFQPMGLLSNAPGDDSYAQAVSDDGAVIVGTGDTPAGRRAFRWTETTGMVNLGTLPGGDESRAAGVSADGVIVAGSVTTADVALFGQFGVWSQEAGWRTLVSPDDFATNAQSYAISADGSIILGSNNNVGTPIVWTATTGLVDLPSFSNPPLGLTAPQPTDVNSDGSLITGTVIDVLAGRADAVIWQRSENGDYSLGYLRDFLVQQGLSVGANSIWNANSVSADGRVIAGRARTVGGGAVAFIAVLGPIPEPTSAALTLGLGLLTAGTFPRRRAFPLGWENALSD